MCVHSFIERKRHWAENRTKPILFMGRVRTLLISLHWHTFSSSDPETPEKENMRKLCFYFLTHTHIHMFTWVCFMYVCVYM